MPNVTANSEIHDENNLLGISPRHVQFDYYDNEMLVNVRECWIRSHKIIWSMVVVQYLFVRILLNHGFQWSAFSTTTGIFEDVWWNISCIFWRRLITLKINTCHLMMREWVVIKGGFNHHYVFRVDGSL